MTDTPKSMRHSLAAMTRWSKVDPDKRSAQMKALSELATAKKAAEREAREARGETVKPLARRVRSGSPMPPISQLLPLMESIQIEREAAARPPLSEDQLAREAMLRLRRTVAESTYRALKGDS